MRFMVELWAQQMEANPEQTGLWDKYPFESDDEEIWVRRDNLSADTLMAMVRAMRSEASRQMKETEELEVVGRMRKAGITGVVRSGEDACIARSPSWVPIPSCVWVGDY